MTENEINIEEIEKKILKSPKTITNKLKTIQTQTNSIEKPKNSQKKSEPLRKTFYNFNNIYKVQDFKFLTQKNFNHSQHTDDRKHNLLIQSFRNNVATFLILRKYKGSMEPFQQKNQTSKGKNKVKNQKNDSELFNIPSFQDFANFRIGQDQTIEKMFIEVKIVLGEKVLNHKISSETLQSEFMNKFSNCLDFTKIEESEDFLNNITSIYDQFIKDLTSKNLKAEIDKTTNELIFLGFPEEFLKPEGTDKDSEEYLPLKRPKQEIIHEILKEELKKIAYQSNEQPESFQTIPIPNQTPELSQTVINHLIAETQAFKPISSVIKPEDNEEEKSPCYMEVMLGLREPEELQNYKIGEENIIDKLLNAKDLFDVDLEFMRPKVTYPEIPELQFKNEEEKKIFSEIHNWLFEMETELEEENRAILEYKRKKQWDDPQNIFRSDYLEAEEEDEDEEEDDENTKIID